ncbi:hypothetical protein RvY_15747 [Ramazzottius varieornatus]|uniref:Uncharacterized protein n=1 Tax=Ramazzottius varieornatus TaxID=947166 RepID=A0A1D1VW05_RAMVA|nr:hypothetical protein RvY_15747 [Ramazzottius varieornatus]
MALDAYFLDNLDIPAIPDFSDPNFNPYEYDGADAWFATHRETYTRSQMNIFSQDFYPAQEVVSAPLQVVPLPPKTPHQDSYVHPLTPQVNNLPPKALVAVQKVKATTARIVLPPRPHSHVEGKLNKSAVEPSAAPRVAPASHRLNHFKTAKAVRVNPLVTKPPAYYTVAKTANIIPQKAPVVPVQKAEVAKPVMTTIAFPKKATVPTAPSHVLKPLDRTIAHSHNVALGMGLGRPGSNASSKKDKMDGGSGGSLQKRRSVEAAKAGEYFANILRVYSIDNAKNKPGPTWK